MMYLDFLRTSTVSKIDILWTWLLLGICSSGIAIQFYSRACWWQVFGDQSLTWSTLEKEQIVHERFSTLLTLEATFGLTTIPFLIGVIYSLIRIFLAMCRLSPLVFLFHAIIAINIAAYIALIYKIWASYKYFYI